MIVQTRRLGPTDGRDDGFVLIAVIAALALLALVALLLTKAVMIDTKIAAYVAEQAQEEELADGLARLAIYHLSVNPPTNGKSGPFRLDGVPLFCRLNDTLANIAVLDADGLVNINYASHALLARLITGIGMTADDAALLATAILDFRSAGDTSISGGSKLAAYQAAGLAHGPKNGAFQTVRELDQVLGMTPEVFARLMPLATVHSRLGIIRPNVASLPVVLALSGDSQSPHVVPDPQGLDALRSKLDLPPAFTSIARTRSSSVTSSATYAVRVAIFRGRGARLIRQVTVAPESDPKSGVGLKEWATIAPNLYGDALPQVPVAPPCIGGVLWLTP